MVSKRGCDLCQGCAIAHRSPRNTSHRSERALAGTSRETITRLLSEFRRNETAEWKGSALITHNQPAWKHMVRA